MEGATGLRDGNSRLESHYVQEIFLQNIETSSEPTEPPVRRIPVLFLGWKTAGRVVNRWHPSSAEVTEEMTCNSSPRMCLQNKLFVAAPLVRRRGLSARTVRLGFYVEHSGTVTGFPPGTSIFPPVSIIPSVLHTHWSNADPVRIILVDSVVK